MEAVIKKDDDTQQKYERYHREAKPFVDELNKLLALRAPSGMINQNGVFTTIYPPETEIEKKIKKEIEQVWRSVYMPQVTGICKRCKREPAVTDYNGNGHFVCTHCDDMLQSEFEDEYR